MNTNLLALVLCALSVGACGGVAEQAPVGQEASEIPSEAGVDSPAAATFETHGVFETNDATYALGEHVNDQGELAEIEVVFDSAKSYLTPQPQNEFWIVDHAFAHSLQRPLLLAEVDAIGLYVRECVTGEWVNAEATAFAAQGELVQGVYERQYFLSHFYGNVENNQLLDPRFECPTEPASFTTVTIDGSEKDVQRVGSVEFAYVVEHRQ